MDVKEKRAFSREVSEEKGESSERAREGGVGE